MSAINFILSLARKILARESKGITTIPNKMAVEQKAGEIAATLQNAGLPLNRADEFIKSEQDLTRILNMIESTPPIMKEVPSGIRNTKTAKIMDMEGKEINPRSKIMGGKQSETEAEIAERLGRENKESAARIKNKKMVKDAIDNVSPGFVKGDRKYNAQLVAEDLAEKRFGKDFYDLDQKQQTDLYGEAFDGLSVDLEDFAQGGRAGFKDGMTRRTFLKILGGMAAVPIVGKFFKLAKVGQAVKKVPVIKTDDVAGKPEWFDALVNKVIAEGDDVTKRFATAERQSIHQKKLDDGSVVRVTEDTDQGAVRVEYESEANVFGDPVQMEYKKPLPDEGNPRPTGEFTTAESGPVGRADGPDDFSIDVDEVGGSSIRDLDSDVSKLKEYATGKGPTMREIVQNKKRRDKAAAITDNIDGAQSDAVVARQGDYDPSDYDDFASGGIARLLGE